MPVLALVEYSFIKELCDKIRREKKTFAGKLKNGRPTEENSKTRAIKRLLLSKKFEKKSKKPKPTDKSNQTARFRQGSSFFGSSESSEESDESSGSSIDTASESDDADESRSDTSVRENDKNGNSE